MAKTKGGTPKSFMREKKIYCGEWYREVDIFLYTAEQQKTAKRGKRAKKEKVSEPKQRELNDANAQRYIIQLGNSNFHAGDLHTTLTYNDKYLPATPEKAEKEIANYIRRVQYRREKEGLPPLKYILVTAYSFAKDGTTPIRIHHHIIMNEGLDRDTVEDLWCKRKEKGQKKGESLGFVNADRLQPDENGIAALCVYLAKNPGGKKRWSSSHNLKRPESRNNDHRYSKREVERIAKDPVDVAYWEEQYPGWTLTDTNYGATAKYNEITGWSIYLKLRKKE